MSPPGGLCLAMLKRAGVIRAHLPPPAAHAPGSGSLRRGASWGPSPRSSRRRPSAGSLCDP
eukprot:943696-Pyramimonas_sp.AAC.1